MTEAEGERGKRWIAAAAKASDAVATLVCDHDKRFARFSVAQTATAVALSDAELDGKSGLALIALGIAALNASDEHHMRDAGEQIRVCVDLVVMLATSDPAIVGPKPGEPER